MNAGTWVRELIADQAKAWRVALQAARPLPREGRLLFVGSGSSYYVAQVAAEVACRQGVTAEARPAADLCLEPDVTLNGVSRVVVISRSGETSEALWAAANAKRQGLPVMGLSANPASPLMDVVHQAVAHEEWEDHTVVMIRSFTSLLVYLEACLAVGDGGDGSKSQESVFRLPEAFPSAYEAAEPLLRQWSGRVPRRIVLLGAGVRYGIALEGMLKLTEMSHVATVAYNPLEFRHGPRGALTAEDLVVLLGQAKMAGEEGALMRELGTITPHVAVIATAAWFEHAAVPNAVIACRLPADVEDLWAGPLATVPLQRLAWQVAIAAGRDPDRPEHLDKVVHLDHGQS